MNRKRLTVILLLIFIPAGVVVASLDDKNTHNQVSTAPQITEHQEEPVKVEQTNEQEQTEVKPQPVDDTPKVTVQQQKESICDITYGPEITPGICQMDSTTFNSLARTVAPQGSKMFNALLNANNRIYKTDNQSVYIPLCNLPYDLKGNNGHLVGEYRQQLKVCSQMITRALDVNDPIYSTSWGNSMRAVYGS